MAVNDEIPKSRLTLTYRTAVSGEAEDVALPFRLLVLGDLSGGTAKDREVDLDQREIRNLDGTNLSDVMADMNMSVKFNVANKIDPERAEELEVELPITSMKSFQPSDIAQNVPKIKALLLLRKLMRALAQDEQGVNALLEQLKDFDNFKVPTGKSGGDN